MVTVKSIVAGPSKIGSMKTDVAGPGVLLLTVSAETRDFCENNLITNGAVSLLE